MAERRAAAKVRREAKAASELAELKSKATSITAEYRAKHLTPSVIEGFIGEIVNSVVHRVPTVCAYVTISYCHEVPQVPISGFP